jgi:hypothetical protein
MGTLQRGHSFGSAVSSETNTVDATTAEALTVPAAATVALVTAGANAIRYRLDGNDPTASVGHYVAANGNLEVFINDLKAVRFISTTGTSVLFVTYFKE